MKISFIGLGVMGFPMAGHLQQHGHDVTVYNRSVGKALSWAEKYGGSVANSPAEAAGVAELLCLCVGDDDDVRSVLLGEQGVFSTMPPGGVVVDHTTASAGLAREMSERAAESSLGFLDAPVSGGQAGAENAALTIMVGGEPTTFERVSGILEVYARCVRLLGPSGSGQLAKMVNQICIAGILQGLAEGLCFSERAGLDTHAVVEVISEGAAQSWQMVNRYETMLSGDYEHGFAVDWMRKDLGMVLREARKMGLDLPITAQVDEYYADVQSMGGGRWDTSSLFARMRVSAVNGGEVE